MPGGWRGSRRCRGRGTEASTVHAGLCSSVFLFREDSHKVLYTESSILSYLPDPPGAREDTRWERRRGGSLPFWRAVHWNEWPCPPLPPRPFVFSVFLHPASIPSSQSFRFSLFLSPLSPPPSLFFLLLSYPWTLERTFLPSLSDLQPRFFLRFFLKLRLPRICQDYLSFAKGRSRLNLKHHLNKRGVTARLFPAGTSGREIESL